MVLTSLFVLMGFLYLLLKINIIFIVAVIALVVTYFLPPLPSFIWGRFWILMILNSLSYELQILFLVCSLLFIFIYNTLSDTQFFLLFFIQPNLSVLFLI